MGKRRITKYTLRKSTEHLFYEAQMFYVTLVFLRKSMCQIEKNILLDAFAIHARNLFNFFYPKQKNIKPDDMSVIDFIDKPKFFNTNKTKERDLIFIIKNANKQVAHLTYARNRYNQDTKRWDPIDIGKKIRKTLNAFYNSLPSSYKGWQHIRNLKELLINYRLFEDGMQ